MPDLSQYFADAKLDAASFRVTHPDPVLVYRGSTAKVEASEEPLGQFKTRHVTTEHDSTVGINAAEAALAKPNTVFEVKKQKGGTYADRISIGRTKSSDVQLMFPRVSKFHAYIRSDAEGTTFALTDAGSTNGTQVDGTNLTANVAAPLLDGAVVSFGPYEFTFFTPAGFYAFLQPLLPRK